MIKLIEVRGATKKFGGLIAVNDFGFYVKKGEIVGLIGPNGAGKTTLFNLIMGDLRQDSGHIFFNEEEISNYPTYERVKKGIARTYQIPKYFSEFTVKENIRLSMIPKGVIKCMRGGGKYDDAISKIGEDTGLTEYFSSYPTEMSIGNLRILQLAMVFPLNPKAVLIDEVFSGLTSTEIAKITKLIEKKREEGTTFVIIDHNLKALSPLADRVVVMNFGKKIADGSYREIVKDEEVKKAYLGM